ncbi:MAG: SIMPL domain-containing protein [Paracoccaceae bacterium]
MQKPALPFFRNPLSGLMLALLLGTTMAAPQQTMAQDAPAAIAAATVSVSGEGTVDVVPDMATLWIGVTTRADTAGGALSANAEAMNAVIAKLTKAGIEARDLQTSSLSLQPDWDSSKSYSSSDSVPFVAQNQLSVRIRAIERVGEIVDLAVAEGGNTVNGLSFGLQDQQPAMDQARKLALAEALRKAGLYADELGMKLGAVQAVNESGFVDSAPMYRRDAAMGSSTPVVAGEISISASVSVVIGMVQP